MNGLLHRMAARAAGTAVTVRSDAGLPYAGGIGSDLGDFSEPQAHVPTGAARVAQVPPASAMHVSDRATPRPADPAEPPAVVDLVRAPPPLVDVWPDAGAVRDTPAIGPTVEPTQRRTFDAPPSTLLPQPEAPLVARSATEPRIEAAHATRSIVPTARTALRADEPAPLMPRDARPTPLAPQPQPANRRGALPQASAATQSESDTEVHIHIGRIDVTALHETPAPRRRAAATPAPLSLDGYLAQRGRS